MQELTCQIYMMDFENRVLVTVTEKRTKEELDDLVKAIGGVL